MLIGGGGKFIPLNSYGKAEFMPKCSNKIHSPGKEQTCILKQTYEAGSTGSEHLICTIYGKSLIKLQLH